jgi:hypothetical protein
MTQPSRRRTPLGGLITSVLVVAALLVPAVPASAEIVRGVGDVTNAVVYGDGAPLGMVIADLSNQDDAVANVSLPFPVNFFGTSYSALCVTTNGGVYPIASVEGDCANNYDETLEDLAIYSQAPIIAPLAADINLENHPAMGGEEVLDDGFGQTGQIYVGTTTVDGKDAIALTWYRVQMYDSENDEALTNTFQIVLLKDATATGETVGYDFSIQFNYGSIQDAEDGYQYLSDDENESGDDAPFYWGVGWASFVPPTAEQEAGEGDDAMGTSDAYELFPTTPREALVDGATTSLTGNSLNSDVDGRYTFSMVNGVTVGFGVPVMDGSGEVEPEPTVPVAPVITSGVAPAGTVNSQYSHTVVAAGDAPLTFAVTAGELPTGLALNESTGVISGLPTVVGTATFSITATNPAGVATQESTVVIVAAPLTPEAPVPTPVPTPDLALVLGFAAGDAASGATIGVAGEALMVQSDWAVTMYSTPVVLASGVVDASGTFAQLASLPASAAPGAHTLILTGISPAGVQLSATAWFSILADGTIGEVSYLGPIVVADIATSAGSTATTLAATGTDVTAPLSAAALLLMLGLLALVVRRRGVRSN